MQSNPYSKFHCIGLVCQSSIHAYITQLQAKLNCQISESAPYVLKSPKFGNINCQRFVSLATEGSKEQIEFIPVNSLIQVSLSIPSGIDILILSESAHTDTIQTIKKHSKEIPGVSALFDLPASINRKIHQQHPSSLNMKMRKIAVN